MKTQSPQIISHPARTIRFRANPQPLRHMIAQGGGIAKPLWQQHEQTQRLKQGHDTLIAKPKAQARWPSTTWDRLTRSKVSWPTWQS
jgi:hypothetical protein